VTTPARTPGAVRELLERSNRLGTDLRNTNYAGGNTSAKVLAPGTVTAEDTAFMWVKEK
jgi:rhamnose utilization protein RhaD (predicted bifunctional aldolase and dehydrogenase)